MEGEPSKLAQAQRLHDADPQKFWDMVEIARLKTYEEVGLGPEAAAILAVAASPPAVRFLAHGGGYPPIGQVVLPVAPVRSPTAPEPTVVVPITDIPGVVLPVPEEEPEVALPAGGPVFPLGEEATIEVTRPLHAVPAVTLVGDDQMDIARQLAESHPDHFRWWVGRSIAKARAEQPLNRQDAAVLAVQTERLSEELALPRLGCATTAELLEELHARIEVAGGLDYRTVDHA